MMLAERDNSPYYYGPHSPVAYLGYHIGMERMVDVLPEIRSLHKEECAVTEACWLSFPTEINYFMYLSAEQSKQLIMFTVRRDGEIVGNLLYHIKPYENVVGALGATDTGLYIKPDFRIPNLARKLMEYAESVLKQVGVHYIVHGDKAPVGGADLKNFFGRQGYKPFSVSYVKEINPLERGL